MEITFAGLTDIGRRNNNEDAFAIDGELGLFVVADGMGGYEGGEIASAIAVETIMDFVASDRRDPEGTWPSRERATRSYEENLLDAAIATSHEQIVQRRSGPLGQMGSTVVAVLVKSDRLIVAHVGDSRLYRLRAGRLSVLTRDHSCWEELRRSGRRAQGRFPIRNQITRALGVPGAGHPDVASHPLIDGDAYLLCSDGLYEPLDALDLKSALALDPTEGCARLIARALERGGTDNLTGVIARITGR